MKTCLLVLFFIPAFFSQTEIPGYYKTDDLFTDQIKNIVSGLNIDGNFDVGEDGIEQISFAVIDMTDGQSVIAGYNMDNFIYPASVYKIYVAMEILKQVFIGRYRLDQLYVVKSPNNVDKSKQIETDARPVLKENDTVTINYLLDLMITRSDNSAANCLIDLAGRENINKTIKDLGWEGSEVTRKFLSRKFEDPGYEKIRSTETSALHSADFMYKAESGTLINYWVSQQLKALLCRQLDNTKLAQGFPKDVLFCNKTGWWSYWTNDVGIVNDGRIKFIIACFLPVEEEKALPIFREIADKTFRLIKERNQ